MGADRPGAGRLARVTTPDDIARALADEPEWHRVISTSADKSLRRLLRGMSDRIDELQRRIDEAGI